MDIAWILSISNESWAFKGEASLGELVSKFKCATFLRPAAVIPWASVYLFTFSFNRIDKNITLSFWIFFIRLWLEFTLGVQNPIYQISLQMTGVALLCAVYLSIGLDK